MAEAVLITGCSTGFGHATAQRFARAGWNVIATMRSPERSDLAAPNVLVTELDVQDPASIAGAIAAGIERFGAIDVLVNNAGFGLHGVFEATPREKMLEQFEVNVFGLMDVTRAVLPHMRAQHRGTILNVTSGAGVFGVPMMALYCGSKFAIEGFTEALSYELATVGIVVKLIEPGGVLDSQFVERSTTEAGQTSAIADYQPFLTASLETYKNLRTQRAGATSQDVAEVIFGAATDDREQLRYVATAQIASLVAARRETNEGTYLATVRQAFGYKR